MRQAWIDAAWVREQLDRSRKTQRALATSLNLDPSGVSRLLEGSRKIKTEEIPLLLDFFGSGGALASAPEAAPVDRGDETPRNEGHPRRSRPGPKPRTKGTDDLPVYGTLMRLAALEFEVRDPKPAEYRARPPQLVGVLGAYAIFVPDGSLSPRYHPGEVLYVHPGKPPIVGTDVVVRFREGDARLVIGRVLALDEDALLLTHPGQQDPPERARRTALRLPPNEVGQVGRILLASSD